MFSRTEALEIFNTDRKIQKNILYSVVILAGISLFFPLDNPVSFIPGFILSFILPGLAFILLVGNRNRPLSDNIFIIPIISPILLTLPVLGILTISGNIGLSIRLSTWLFYLVLIVSVMRRRDNLGNPELNMPEGVIILSIGYGALVVLVYIINDLLLIRSDAWYHASVTGEILTRGIPPEEPWLPDRPIRYMWIYHLFLASWKKLSGLELFKSMAFLNIVSAFSFPYLTARIVAALTENRRRIFISSLIATGGLQSASWIAWFAKFMKAFTGEVRGMEEISRIIKNAGFSGSEVIQFITPEGTSQINLASKFITITPFSYSLDLFLLCFVIFLSRNYIKRRRISSSIFIFIVTLGSFLFHVVIGTALIISLVGAGLLLLLIYRFSSERDTGYCIYSLPALMAILVAASGFPYLSSMGAMEGNGTNFLEQYLHFGIRNTITFLLPLVILFWPVWRTVRQFFSSRRDEYTVMATWIIPLILLNILINLPLDNEDKLTYPLLLLLGPAVCIEITGIIRESAGIRKTLILLCTFILFFTPTFLVFQGYTRGNPAQFDREIEYRIYRGDRAFFETIRKMTDKKAIIAEKNYNHLIPVFARRRNLGGNLRLSRVLNYDYTYVSRYHSVNKELFACKPIDQNTEELMDQLKFDFYIAVFHRDMAECPYLRRKFGKRDDLFRVVFSSEKGILYHYRPGEYN